MMPPPMKAQTFRSKTIFLLGFIILYIAGCKPSPAPIAQNELPEISSNDKVQIYNWSVIGPFSSLDNQAKNTLELNDLEQYGISENNISEKDILSLFNKIEGHLDKNISIKSMQFTNENIDLYELYAKPDLATLTNAYLICKINSPKEQTVNILSSSSFGSKVWINNDLVCTVVNKKYLDKIYEEYKRIKLKKGTNLVLVKVNSRKINSPVVHWKFSMAVTGNEYAKQNFKIQYLKDFLEQSYAKDSLKIYLGPYKYELPVEYQIFDSNHSIVNTNTIRSLNTTFKYNNDSTASLDISKLRSKRHFYIQLILGNDTLQQPFYHGAYEDTKKTVDSINAGISSIKKSSIQYAVAMQRYNTMDHYYERSLKKKKYKVVDKFPFEQRFINRNKIYAYMNFLDIISETRSSFEKMEFRGFASQIDSTLQTYLFYMPLRMRNKTSVPSVVMVPYEQSDSLALIDSWYSMNLNHIEVDMMLAEKYGYALIYPWLRGGKYRDNSIGYKDMEEVLNDVKKNWHNIDPDKMFLAGSCEGARRLTNIFTAFPDKFAGAWLYSPEMDDKYLQNLTNNYLYIYTSKDDEVIPFDKVKGYIDKSKKYGLDITTKIEEGISHYRYPLNQMEDAFRHYVNFKKKPAPTNIHFSSNELKYNKSFWIEIIQREDDTESTIDSKMLNSDLIEINTSNVGAIKIDKSKLPFSYSKKTKITLNNIAVNHVIENDSCLFINLKINAGQKNSQTEGPVQHVFSNRFIVVTANNKKNADVVQCIKNAWLNKCVAYCITKDEVKISTIDISNSNLILIGEYTTNPIKNILTKMPIGLHNIGKYNGASYCYVYPNPLNKERYVLVIGGDYDSKIFEKFSLLQATHDIYIFNKNHRLNYAKNFNQYWQL